MRNGKRQALVKLERLSDQINYLRQLPHHNKNYKPWNDAVIEIIVDIFGLSSSEYSRYSEPRLAIYVDNNPEEQQKTYIEWLNRCELALTNIIENNKPLPQKIWYECKDFLALVIAKFIHEKTKGA
jgi:hypothetical protein